jgi:anhydro-N-acetylmuramic acid kinase
MSGTSHDAIEAAAADLALCDGEVLLTPLGSLSAPYPGRVREDIARTLPPSSTSMEAVCRLDTVIGQAFADVAQRANEELCEANADLVVSHGQTLYHWVREGRALGSLQVGQPAWIAERTGLPVVSDLRSRDIAAGGQGAPLVSLFDTMLLRDRAEVCAAVNLGGIANMTIVGPGREPLAFDTGPANALLDAAVRYYTGGSQDFDEDGRLAARGRVDNRLLTRLLSDPYYRRAAPKTTGKERFHLSYLLNAMEPTGAEVLADIAATLTALTARIVSRACREHGVREAVVSGGGVHNPVLMARIASEAPEICWRTSESLGVPVEAKEAYAFALLGFLTVHSVAGTEPRCTGARTPSILGTITPGAGPLRLPEPASPPRGLRLG